jgi:hypothetical protein
MAELQLGMSVAIQAIDTIQSVVNAAAQSQLATIDEKSNAEINAVKNSMDSEEEKAAKIESIERKAAMAKYRIELENFNISKGLQITNAIIQTAQAAIAAYSSAAAIPVAGVGLAPAMAAVAAAFGAVQIGLIAAQKPPSAPKFEKGGVLVGPSHSDGGIPVSVDGRGGYEAEGGEIVLTKGVYRDPHLRQIASDINVAGGGVPIVSKVGKFAMGGALGGSTTFAARSATAGNGITQQQMTQAMSDAMVNAPAPVVRVSDINRVSSDVRRVQVASELR